jgi:hypothetical protein
MIDSTFKGSTCIPSLETMNPKSLPISMKNALVWIQANIIVLSSKKNVSKMLNMMLSMRIMIRKFIYIRIHYVLNIVKGIQHGPQKSGSSIFKAKS